MTGFGQRHLLNVRKNTFNNVGTSASGCRLQTHATRMAQLTPPKNPNTFEYSPWTCAHSLTVLRTSRKDTGFGIISKSY